MLAKKSFRDFVYTLVGYTPKTEELNKWKYFLDRVDLNFNNPPEGYFSIFQEMVKPIHALISKFPSYLERKVKNLELPSDAKRDILSVLNNNTKAVNIPVKKLSSFIQNLKKAIDYKPN